MRCHSLGMANASQPVIFGSVPGVQEGDVFPNREALRLAKVHRVGQAGIAGGAREGADSIVMSGGYPDDRDQGDVIYYTGHGGRENGVQVRDQSWSSPGNAGLVRTSAMRKPVRVVEGLDIRGGRRRRAMGGYRYRGLYRIADFWMTAGVEGFQVCQFELRKIVSEEVPIPPPAPAADAGAEQETEVERNVRRLVAAREEVARDWRVAYRVKEMYNDRCQICRERILVSLDDQAFSNCAHIKALGRPHDGPDRIENVLCLCPNCHVRFDRGVFLITDDFQVIDSLRREKVADLYRADEHEIAIEYVQAHRSRWPGRIG